MIAGLMCRAEHRRSSASNGAASRAGRRSTSDAAWAAWMALHGAGACGVSASRWGGSACKQQTRASVNRAGAPPPASAESCIGPLRGSLSRPSASTFGAAGERGPMSASETELRARKSQHDRAGIGAPVSSAAVLLCRGGAATCPSASIGPSDVSSAHARMSRATASWEQETGSENSRSAVRQKTRSASIARSLAVGTEGSPLAPAHSSHPTNAASEGHAFDSSWSTASNTAARGAATPEDALVSH
eukprot:scaffold12640_cov106-Isochrysis_galbana.AAC.10